MNEKVLVGVKNKRFIKNFVGLKKRIYSRDLNTQDIKTEIQLLTGKHILSHYFKVIPVMVLDSTGVAAVRGIVTLYEDDENAYLGLFEVSRLYTIDTTCLELFFKKVDEIARKYKKKSIIGLYDASFWIRYRVLGSTTAPNIDPYSVEPYNRLCYQEVLSNNGYKVTDEYKSYYYRVPSEEDCDAKCKSRLDLMLSRGYKFVTPTFANFNLKLKGIYNLMILCYSKFPTFKPITEDEFCKMFGGLRYVLDYDMVKLVYKDNDLVGFFVCIPDYGCALNNPMSICNIVKILKIKLSKHKNYILLYLGINPEHPGLGGALSEVVRMELSKKKAESIGALIHTGKPNNNFYAKMIKYDRSYYLMRKDLTFEKS